MAAPFTKSGDTIVQDFAAAAQSGSAVPLDFRIGSVFRALGEAVAVVADWLQKLFLFALLISRLQTSRGQWVDSFCADYMPVVPGTNSPRLPASSATGLVTFSRSTPQAQAIIPIGSLVATFDGNNVYQVVADTTNSAYSANIIPGGGYIIPAGVAGLAAPVQALTPGASANVGSGSVSLIRSSLVGVDSVTNPSPINTGFDAESDDALKARFKLFILSLRAGTLDAIEFAITSLRQGLQVKVHENVDPDGRTDYGALTIYVDDGTGGAEASLIQSAALAVDKVRAGGTRPQVVSASLLPAVVTMTIQVADGYYKPDVVAAVVNNIGAYLASMKLEQTLPFTMVEHLAYSASSGVTNVSNVVLNGGSGDLVPSMGQTVRAGSIVVS